MLLYALGAVVVGFAFLIVSLVTQDATWAWACLVACAVGAVLVAADVLRQRRGGRAPSAGGEPTDVTVEAPEVASDVGSGPVVAALVPLSGSDTTSPSGTSTAGSVAPSPRTTGPASVDALVGAQPVPQGPDGSTPEPDALVAATTPEAPRVSEPDEEDPDAADALAVATLEREVLVVDEHPRFHVVGCTWLTERTALGLPAREAVQLGFSPCGWCTPSRTLAAAARTDR